MNDAEVSDVDRESLVSRLDEVADGPLSAVVETIQRLGRRAR